MQKIIVVVALGLLLGWFGVLQFQRVQIDRDAASVSRMIATTEIRLPTLSMPALTFDAVAVTADSEPNHSRVKR
jgi:hypothetical protein